MKKDLNKKMPFKFLAVVVGPTAVGKTALSIQLAKAFNTEIISADSRQFFKEMSIGTAKPLPAEMQEVKHHFINSHTIIDDYNVGKFEEESIQVIDRLFLDRHILLLTGGSGLYINAICKGLDTLPEADNIVREQVTKLYKTGGLEALKTKLAELDPVYYKQVDKANPHRLIRALEICMVSGLSYSSQRKGNNKQRSFKTIKLGLCMEREQLYLKINQRVDDMMNAGLLNEVKGLYRYKHLNALQTVGYKELFDYLDEKYSLETAVDLIKRNTRRFAKRQLTWFRKDKEINWFKPDERDEMIAFIKTACGI